MCSNQTIILPVIITDRIAGYQCNECADKMKRDTRMKITCPYCKCEYVPVLGERKNHALLIQEEFPNALAWEREQLITGICSDECWDKFLGEGEE